MNVEPDYRRAGICAEMIRLAVEVHGRNFGRPRFSAQGGLRMSSADYFTHDGAALMGFCIENDIIDDIEDPQEDLNTYF